MSNSSTRPTRKPARNQTLAVRLSAHGRLRRFALYSGMGLSLLGSGAFSHPASAAPLGSAAWIAQLNAARATGQTAGGTAFTTPGIGSVTTAQQANQQAATSISNMAAALAAISAAQTAQKSAAAALAAGQSAANQLTIPGTSSLPIANGLSSGIPGVTAPGLVPALNLSSDSTSCTNSCWIGASAPQGTTVNGQTTVTVTQNQQKAILTWQSFNIGADTTLYFNQSAGTQANGSNNWIALNRVLGGANNPAQILGSIKAQGSVYIIDQNGIIFGSGSQVNTHSLLASTLDLYNSNPVTSNAYFLNPNYGLTAPPLQGGYSPVMVDSGSTCAGIACKSVVVEQGASITTGDGGFSLIAAPYVTNAGTISATDGQAILIGGDGVVSTTPTPGQLNVQAGDLNASSPTMDYTVINTGVIQSQRGNVTISAANVYQGGAIAVTTSVSQAGSITIEAGYDRSTSLYAGALTFGGNSVTAILPDDSNVITKLGLGADTETTTSSTAATSAFVPGSGTFTGNTVDFQSGSLVEAPGSTLNIAAIVNQNGVDVVQGQIPLSMLKASGLSAPPPVVGGRVYIDSDAVIDVSGLADVQLPVADTLVTIGPLTENDLADSPLLRDGFLFTQTVTVDSTISGVNANGQAWIGSPIIDAGAYIEDVPRTVDQLLVNGGTLNLAGAEVIANQGSKINLSGGYINYQAGVVGGTTNLLGADGKIYNIANADPNIAYVGFAGQTNEVQSRWNTTDSYVSPLLADSGAHYDPGFIQGGNAGALNIFVGGNAAAGDATGTATSSSGTAVLDGIITAQAFAGRNQVASGSQPLGGSFSIGGSSGVESLSYSSFGTSQPYGPSYIITDQNVDLGSNFTSSTAVNAAAGTSLLYSASCAASAACSTGDATGTGDLFAWTPINGQMLANAGFSSISITANQGQIVVAPGAELAVTPGGAINSGGRNISAASINLSAGAVQVLGELSAPSGSINVLASGVLNSPTTGSRNDPVSSPGISENIVNGKLDLVGNIYIGSSAVLNAAGEWVNDTGLGANQISGSQYINGGNISLEGLDVSTANGASILLQPGSVLNVSSGGYVQPSGQLLMKNGIPVGQGGNVTLATQDGYSGTGSLSLGESPFGNDLGLPTPTTLVTSGTIGELVDGAIVNGLYGNLLGYGFSGGGTLTLRALGVEIGNSSLAPSNTPAWDLYLPSTLFSGQGVAKGFGNFVINAEYDATVLPGTQIALTQSSYLPSFAAGTNILLAPTGTNLLQSGDATVGALDPYLRPATNLTLTAGDYLSWIGPADTTGPNYSSYGITGTVSLGAGAAIHADAGASVTLGSLGQVAVDGAITAPGGSIVLNGQAAPAFLLSGNQIGPTTPAGTVVLGTDADLDVSGTVLVNPYAKAVPIDGVMTVPVTGKVLDGGSVSIYGDTVAAAPNAVIDVSGYGVNGSGISFDVAQSSGAYAPEQQWSDAGQITLAASSGLYFEGTLDGQAGSGTQNGASASGQGGSLTLTALGNTPEALILQGGSAQANTPVTANWYQNWSPGQAIAAPTASANTLYFSTGTLQGSGISSLAIGSNAVPGGPAGALTVPGQLAVGFAGNVNLSLGQSFSADATNFIALPQGALALPSGSTHNSLSGLANGISATGGATVIIDAPYVSLSGDYGISSGLSEPSALLGDAVLQVNAQFIDLGGAFALDNFGIAAFNSSGPIRFVNNETYDFVGNSTTPQPGELYTAGNLSFTASELYPASGNSFIVDAYAQGLKFDGAPVTSTITISQAPGTTPTVPLSAGGTLVLDAQTINQNGTVWAPSGDIVLGVGSNTSSFNALLNLPNTIGIALTPVTTQNVSLAPGSLTSVSLDNAVIPYGTTVDGVEWQYNDGPTANTANGQSAALPDLTAPPSKLIQINGVNVALDSKATVDLSGGGTLQAEEWVPGVGGTSNVLAYLNTSYANNSAGAQVPLYGDGRGVYALVPSYEAPVAAYDPVFNQGQAPIAVGESVYISGAPGLPAGTYTVMPALYATLPGAYRIVQNTSAVNLPSSLNTVLPDGTQLVAGYFVNALSGARESTTTQFEIQSAATWGLYSQYNLANANTFFASLAAQNGTVTPLLPQDAGQLILGASTSLALNGPTLLTQASASGGAAAQIDIASQNIDIVGTAGAAPASGVLQLTASQLNSLGAGTLLIGGTSTQTASGIDITALANSVVVSGNASLQAPQIILVANADNATRNANGSINCTGSCGVQVDSGSTITATPLASGAAPAASNPITIVADSSTSTSTADGAFLMVSNAQPAALTRQGTLNNTGELDIQGGATIGVNANSGLANSLILDSSGINTLDSNATVGASNVTADAGSIVFLANNTTVPASAAGSMIIGSGTLGQFAGAQQIDLRSYGSIDFESSGGSTFVIPVNKGNLTLSADQFTDGAYGQAAPVQINVPNGTLVLTNDLSPAASITPSTGSVAANTLSISAQEIDLGTAGNATSTSVSFAGFSGFNATAAPAPNVTGATAGIVLQGGGTPASGSTATSSLFNFGDMPVSLTAPVILAGANSAVTLQTGNTITLAGNGTAALPAAGTDLGGAMTLQGAAIDDQSAVLTAAGGDITLHATGSGSALNLGPAAVINVAGVGKQFFDITEYANGGNIVLTADNGNIVLGAGTTLDFAAASGGGNAGSLSLSAPSSQGAVQFSPQTIIEGGAAAGQGGSFSLNSGQSVSLDSLAGILNTNPGATGSPSGPFGTISVTTGSGDLALSAAGVLTAQTVSLTANGGAVTIAGTINASGQGIDVANTGDIANLTLQSQQAGGTINLYGTGGVTVSGTLKATSSPICIGSGACTDTESNFYEYAPLQLGGTINIGTAPTGTYVPTATNFNNQYGYENIANSGAIDIGAGAQLNVSGGSASTLASNGLIGGTVNLRAPLLESGDVNVTVDPAAVITGSRATTLEAYAIWSTVEQSSGAKNGTLYFDGIIDPAGWYNANGTPVPGTYYDQDGNVIASGSIPNANDPNLNSAGIYFVPTSPNPAHVGFYQTTLVNFVENPGFTGPNLARLESQNNLGNFTVAPGIELDNPSAAQGGTNGGNITIATNWNLGATGASGQYLYRYSYQGLGVAPVEVAPILTLRAGNNLNIDASISDGFVQQSTADLTYSSIAAGAANSLYATISNASNTLCKAVGISCLNGTMTITVNGVRVSTGNASAIASFDSSAAGQSVDYYAVDYPGFSNAYLQWSTNFIPRINNKYTVSPAQLAATAPSLSSYSGNYTAYLSAYSNWLTSIYKASSGATPPAPTAPPDASTTNYSAYLKVWSSYAAQVVSGDIAQGSHPVYYVFAPSPPTPSQNLNNTASPPGGPVNPVYVAALAEGNSPANVATLTNLAPLASATLAGGNSSSYRLVAGADLASANPLALAPVAGFAPGEGTVTIAGGTQVADEIYNCTTSCAATSYSSNAFPNVVRTGNGSIAIAAAYNFDLSPSVVAPGAVYTAGVPASAAGAASNPEAGGSVSILAQNSIVGVENVNPAAGIVTGFTPSTSTSYLLWAPWMESANCLSANLCIPAGGPGDYYSAINFGAFDQGIMSVGGNVSISAGNNIQDLSVSLPTTWYLSNNGTAVNTVGGGNLTVNAGQNILSGDYFVAQGSGSITAGGQIASDKTLSSSQGTTPLAIVLALQNGVMQVNARQGVDIAAVYDPSYLAGSASNSKAYDEQGYSTNSSLTVTSTAGDVSFNTLSMPALVSADGAQAVVLPATFELTALGGGISVEGPGELYPSPMGELSLIADQSIALAQDWVGQYQGTLGLLDESPSTMPSPLQPNNGAIGIDDPVARPATSRSGSSVNHDPSLLHADDPVPVRIYSLQGSIVNGTIGTAGTSAGFMIDQLLLSADKPAQIYAGQDIVDLSFLGQNLTSADVTRIIAGRDIYDTPLAPVVTSAQSVVPALLLAGEGDFDIEAGRNIGPLASQTEAITDKYVTASSGVVTGIEAVGDTYNPFLPHQSASVNVLFGVGPSLTSSFELNDQNFINTYIAPGASVAGVPNYSSQLASFVSQYDPGYSGDAWTAFQSLPGYVQQLFVEQVFSNILYITGQDYNNVNSTYYHQYARGYDAINSLFPSSLGYTQNNLSGGTNGSNSPKTTGNLDMRGSTIQTQEGGAITIFGPGGQALLGSNNAPPFVTALNGTRSVVLDPPNTQGILTLEGGDIDIFTDQSLLLAQSRIFTEQGGNMLIWSSNGDINAGNGLKSNAYVPPLQYVCDLNEYCYINPSGEVTGAGIATLQTVNGAPPGNVELVAPRGTVDAGNAGIRVSGNLTIAALHVANVFNIQVKGTTVGVPTTTTDVGALNAANSAAAAAQQATDLAPHQQQNAASLITVEVVGFGEPDAEQKKKLRGKEGL